MANAILPAMTLPVYGLMLAGGRGRRMGGVDKGLVLLNGRPLAAHVVERLRPQVRRLLISANANLDAYRSLGGEVVTDRIDSYAGPLAGLDAGLHAAALADAAALLVIAPCDAPFLPPDLVARLAAARAVSDADVAVARTGARLQPVFALLHMRVRSQLALFLQGGGRKVEDFYATLRGVEVAFDDEADAFVNLNTRAELEQFER